MAEKHPFSCEDQTSENEADLICSICHDRFHSPVTLTCLHSFCKECLQNYIENGGSQVSCPTCRASLILPKGGVDRMVSNLSLQALIDAKCPLSSCAVCKKTENLSYCAHCSLEICRACISMHKPEMFAVIKRSFEKLKAQNEAGGSYDNLHQSAERAKSDVDEQIERFIRQLKAKQDELNERIDQLLATNSSADEKHTDADGSSEECREILRRADEALRSWELFPQNQAQMLYADCCKMENRKGLKEVNISFPNVNELHSEIQNFGYITMPGYSFVKSRQEPASASHDFPPEPFKEHRIQNEIASCGSNHPIDVIRCDGGPAGLTSFNDVLCVTIPWSECVNIYDNTLHRNTIMCQIPNSGKFEPRDIIAIQNGDFIVSGNECLERFTAQGTLMGVITGKRIGKKSQLVSPRGIFFHNDELFVVDRDKKNVQVMTIEGLFIRKFGKGILKEPRYIAISKDERAFVTDKNKMKIFTVGGHFLQKILVPGASVWTGLRGITVDSDGNILVCVPEQNHVRRYNPDLFQIGTIGSKFLSSPQSVCCLSGGRIAVSDWSQKKVFIFQANR